MTAGVRLDQRAYEDLVAQARARVALVCPEMSLNGGPDAAGTLIELFSWMSSLAIDRLGRVPEKLHIELIDLLGIRLHGPSAATTGVRFRLSAPARRPVLIKAGTAVATERSPTEPPTVFEIEQDFMIAPVRPASYMVQRGEQVKEIGLVDGVAKPHGPDQLPFSRQPVPGDALYIGFEATLSRLLMQVTMDASVARGAGIKPEDPPLRWEASLGEGQWGEVDVMQDQTGGFNYGSGVVEIQCPTQSGIEGIAGRRMHWLRCRIAATTRISGEQAVFTQSPEIYSLTAAPIGALLPAENSTSVRNEALGESSGNPSQSFSLANAPILTLERSETVEVETPGGDWDPWEEIDSFAASEETDRHYQMDLVHGVVRFGPELRNSKGDPIQKGAIPRKGAAIRMSRYRHGGGRAGNVAPEALTTLRSAIPGVASVSNPHSALGGVDPQAVSAAQEDSAYEIRTRYRAVTAEDYEFLAVESSPRVARALRVMTNDPGVTIRILPNVDPADRRLSFEELNPDERLYETVRYYLDQRKLVGCPLHLLPVRLRGVSVVVNLQVAPRVDMNRVEREVRRSLYTYLNPLIGGTAGAVGTGWPFGRSLNQGELYAIVNATEGIDFVKFLRLYEYNIATSEQAPKAAGRQVAIESDEVIASGEHIVRVVRRPA